VSTIMVGIDASSASRAALSWAAARAKRLGDDLRVVHIVDDEWGAGDIDLEMGDRALAESLATLRREFPSLPATGTVVVGNPVVELVRSARAVDLLVVGTHKTGFVQGRVFGSQALRLAAESAVAVAVIPEYTTGAREGVVVGVDSSAASDAAVVFAALEARHEGVELVLVLATGVGKVLPGGRTDRGERELRTMTRALRIAEASAGDAPIRVRTLRRAPASALIDVGGRARLVVVGSSRRHLDGAAALGPVAHDVLVNITSPTVVVHPRESHGTFDPFPRSPAELSGNHRVIHPLQEESTP